MFFTVPATKGVIKPPDSKAKNEEKMNEQSSATPILYGHPLSLYTRKARLALLFQGVEHRLEPVTPHADDPGFCGASPLGKIPAFRDEHTAFADSTVIAHYINKFYPGTKLVPETRDGYAKTLWLEEYCDTVMAPVVGGHLFAEVVLAGRLFPREPIQQDIDKATQEEMPKIYPFLEQQLGESLWFAGEELSLADIAIGTMLITAYHCGETVPDTAPRLQAFMQRFLALPVVQGVLNDEIAVLKAMEYDSPIAV